MNLRLMLAVTTLAVALTAQEPGQAQGMGHGMGQGPMHQGGHGTMRPDSTRSTHGGAQSERGNRPASSGAADSAGSTGRWFAPEHVRIGAPLYGASCARCHGPRGQGAPGWRQPGPGGKRPAPPLDGTGHTWHHPLRALAYQIKFGTPGGKGAMPGFSSSLSDAQVLAIIAWLQDKWPDDLYATWLEIDTRARAEK